MPSIYQPRRPRAPPLWQLLTGDPDGPAWSPGMVDVPLRGANKVHNWFWSPDQDHAIASTETLVRMYDQSVGRNCNFVIGAAIQPDGTLPEPDAKRLAEFGAEIKRRCGRPVAETNGEGETLELQLPAPALLDAVMRDNAPIHRFVQDGAVRHRNMTDSLNPS